MNVFVADGLLLPIRCFSRTGERIHFVIARFWRIISSFWSCQSFFIWTKGRSWLRCFRSQNRCHLGEAALEHDRFLFYHLGASQGRNVNRNQWVSFPPSKDRISRIHPCAWATQDLKQAASLARKPRSLITERDESACVGRICCNTVGNEWETASPEALAFWGTRDSRGEVLLLEDMPSSGCIQYTAEQ